MAGPRALGDEGKVTGADTLDLSTLITGISGNAYGVQFVLRGGGSVSSEVKADGTTNDEGMVTIAPGETKLLTLDRVIAADEYILRVPATGIVYYRAFELLR